MKIWAGYVHSNLEMDNTVFPSAKQAWLLKLRAATTFPRWTNLKTSLQPVTSTASLDDHLKQGYNGSYDVVRIRNWQRYVSCPGVNHCKNRTSATMHTKCAKRLSSMGTQQLLCCSVLPRPSGKKLWSYHLSHNCNFRGGWSTSPRPLPWHTRQV